MADAVTAALLKEADAFGGPKNPGPNIDWGAVSSQASAVRNPALAADEARIRPAELKPNGGGMLPSSTVLDQPPPDPVTASLLAEAGGRRQGDAKTPQSQPRPATPAAGPSTATQEQTPANLLSTAAKRALSILNPVADRDNQETALALGTGAASGILGGLAAIYTLTTSGMDFEKAAETVKGVQDKLTYQPRGEGSKKQMEALTSNVNPINWIPRGAEAVGDVGVKSGILNPAEATAIATAGAMVAPGVALKTLGRGSNALKNIGKVPEEVAPFGSAGSAAATNASSAKAAAAAATPELKAVITAPGRNHPIALARQTEADALPVPVRLTAGQATGDIKTLSNEMNSRGKSPEIAQRLNEQNQQLKENINAIRDEAAPNVYGTNHVENGQALIDAYKATDDAITKDISAKYKALENANGGKFPIDGVAFADSAAAALAKKLKTDFVPSPIAKQLEKFKNGEPMNFEQFEAMRTNLAAEIRKAERSGDGNAAYAAGLVREALESLPMSGEAAALKPVADAARAAAKARFDLLKKDPAYKAAINDVVAADDFINKFVVKGKADNVKQMVDHLGAGSDAQQTMAAGVINYLKAKAGIVNESGNFSQAGYNKALQELQPKLLNIVGAKPAKQLESLGNVARWTQEQPRGAFVNNSNTFVAAAAEQAKGLAEGAANKLGLGILPVGTMIREAAAKRAAAKETMQTLQTGAGIKLKDIKK